MVEIHETLSIHLKLEVYLLYYSEIQWYLFAGWKKCGSIEVAQTKDRLTQLLRKRALAQ